MESLTPLVSISTMTNDEEVDKVPRELLNSWLMPIGANKASSVWQYFAMVKDGLIKRNGIHYIY
jgi:hypothetical protein